MVLKVLATRKHVKVNGLAGLFVWRIGNDMRPDGGAPKYRVTNWMNGYLAG